MIITDCEQKESFGQIISENQNVNVIQCRNGWLFNYLWKHYVCFW